MSNEIFIKGEEYVINQAENEEAKFFLLGKKLHVYSANCSCPGNKIKIDAVGTFTQCSTRSDGEYLYTFSPEDGGENVVLNNNGEITCANKITAGAGIRTKGAFHSTQEFIEFHWGQSPTHCLYVHGGGQSLGSGDAFIQTVS